MSGCWVMAARAICPKTGENHAMNTSGTEQWIERSPQNKGWLDIVDNAVFFTLAMFSCTETPCDELLASVEENSVLVKSIRNSTWGHHCSTLYQPHMSSFVSAEAWLQKQNVLWVCARQRKWENSHKLCRCYCYFINEKMEAQKDTSDLVQTDTSVETQSLYFQVLRSTLFLPCLIVY